CRFRENWKEFLAARASQATKDRATRAPPAPSLTCATIGSLRNLGTELRAHRPPLVTLSAVECTSKLLSRVVPLPRRALDVRDANSPASPSALSESSTEISELHLSTHCASASTGHTV